MTAPTLDTLIVAFVAAWNAHDADAMARAWTDDGDLVTVAGVHARGRAAIRATLAAEHGGALGGTTAAMRVVATRPLGDGLVHADVEMELVEASGRRHMRVSIVARREQAGWRYLVVRPAVVAG